MFETLLQMRIINQKPFSNVAPFDGHLHCSSPLHSPTHRNNKTTTDDSPIKYRKTFAGVLMFTCLFTVIPYWTFYVL